MEQLDLFEPQEELKTNTDVCDIVEWHHRARPEPSARDFDVQLGCHFEEIAEMVKDMTLTHVDFGPMAGKNSHVYATLVLMADFLKKGHVSATVEDRVKVLDSLADQIVTAVGVAHCAGLDVDEALRRVNASNWSKFVDGRPVFDENGKIAKPDTYRAPDLGDLV